jgi:Mn-dependent DtxR family transcriptional regulator
MKVSEVKNMQESGEMYLETILLLSEKKTCVRAIDVCEEMGYSKPSVSRALKLLREEGHVEVNECGYITLTDSGRKIAKDILERHRVLTQLFVGLGVDEQTASADACKIEHSISDATFAAIKKHFDTYSKK